MSTAVFLVLLSMMPLAVYSTLEGFERLLTVQSGNWRSSGNIIAAGIISAVIAVLCFLRFGLWSSQSDDGEPPEKVTMENKRRFSFSQRRFSTRTQQYPQLFFTATRPASVNIKPMLGLSNEIQSFVDRIDQYADKLEGILAARISELNSTKSQLDILLQQLLPPTVAQRFSAGERVVPASFDCVTAYFSDIVGYTTIVATSTAVEMVEFLNAFYRMSDAIVMNYDAYKVETIGDADLIASGIPQPNGTKHASEIAKLALHMMDAIDTFRMPHRPTEILRARIGLHSGHCMAGIVGSKIPKYVLFGDAVSTAAKMESSSEPGRVQMSYTTADILKATGGFKLEARGPIQLKGMKNFETYWLTGRTQLDHK